MSRRRKSQCKTPAQLIHSLLRMPPSDFYHRPILHLDCGGRVEIEGCKGVVQYDEEQIVLDMGSVQAVLRGDDLILEALNGRELQIRGQVLQVELRYG